MQTLTTRNDNVKMLYVGDCMFDNTETKAAEKNNMRLSKKN